MSQVPNHLSRRKQVGATCRILPRNGIFEHDSLGLCRISIGFSYLRVCNDGDGWDLVKFQLLVAESVSVTVFCSTNTHGFADEFCDRS